MSSIRNISISATILFSAALAGCSGEPSSSEIEKAIKSSVEQSNQQAKEIGGSMMSDDMLTVIYEAKKVGCASAEGATGFNCDVELDVSAPFVGRSKKVTTIRFVKSSEGWQAVQ